MDPMALYDVLNTLSLATLAAVDGGTREAEEAYFEASVAAIGAFPEGSPESAALNVILGAVGARAMGAAA
jgi:predicted RNA polymerase sigma factor